MKRMIPIAFIVAVLIATGVAAQQQPPQGPGPGPQPPNGPQGAPTGAAAMTPASSISGFCSIPRGTARWRGWPGSAREMHFRPPMF